MSTNKKVTNKKATKKKTSGKVHKNKKTKERIILEVSVENGSAVDGKEIKITAIKLPFYENSQVLEILRTNDTATLCKMADGTTKWISNVLFK